jgi:hypothetical protein
MRVRSVTLLSAVFLRSNWTLCDGRLYSTEKITVTFVEDFIRLWFLVILYLVFTKFYLIYDLLLKK